MVLVEITLNTLMNFIDPDTMKMEWYGSDMFVGNRIEFRDIVCGNPKRILFLCLDGHIAVLAPDSCRILSMQ